MTRKMIYATFLIIIALLAVLLYPVLKIKMRSSVHPLPVDTFTDFEVKRLFGHVENLSVRIGSRSFYEHDRLTRAADYIREVLDEMSCTYCLQNYEYKGKTFSNIIVTLPGGEGDDGSVVIGAHYDTVYGTPGADDNASAVAVLLELCRLLQGHRPVRTLRFVFFTLEEPPLFRSRHQGSFVYARHLKETREAVHAMVCLEMVGYFSDREGGQSFPVPGMNLLYPTTPNFIAVVGNLQSRNLVEQVRDSIRKGSTIAVEGIATVSFVPGVDFSDHRSFWKMGYPAVMVTDTAFYRNPNYHTENDRIDTLDFLKMAALLRGLVQVSVDLAGTGPEKP
ncbi:MAG TPA: M20/M25/M40 family metallo-hydrolase [Syntrophales bacterium]|jgi:Zn-dependent M28 family amino/carboxypeptidase|nr:M20/M25/M40 family metallo-hydrolase [Syntrophales bacterium]